MEMIRTVTIALGVLLLAGAGQALAQESTPGPGTLEVTVVPAGGTFFTSKGATPEFGNYTYGGALTYNINRIVGIEGEVGGSAGIAQDLALNGTTSNLKTPNTAMYSGNLVISAPTGSSVVPFVAGGVGGLTMFDRPEVGVNQKQTFLTGNVGGGLKWYAPNGRWGLRGDYRLIAVQSKDDGSAFFGQETRYGHRVYVGVLINALR
jgi:hypothetical protein